MKKFKLIKEYPDSPKLGFILEQKSGSVDAEKYPEFWQEIVEKEYEILSFKGLYPSNNTYDFILQSNGLYIYDRTEFTLKTLLNSTKSKIVDIKSIKRLSDGEIFTIGDKTNSGEIQSFKIVENRMVVGFKDNIPIYLNATGKLLTKLKTPLFTTNIKNGIYYDGKYLEMSYEELCDLFARYRDHTTVQQEKFSELKINKASEVFGTLLPRTDY